MTRTRFGRRTRCAVLLMLLAAMSGTSARSEGCVHPYPCGDEWPSGLIGPFPLDEIVSVSVPSHDGTILDGAIALPDLPDGVGAPVVLQSTPYAGTCQVNPINVPPFCGPSLEEAMMLTNPSRVLPLDLVHAGYAVAAFSVRGTGGSGGCFEFGGPNEQKDQAFLTDWLGGRSWSNGRVGMVGLSYHAITAMEAAIASPSALKTVVLAGMSGDFYTMSHTPQGATTLLSAENDPFYTAGVSLLPPATGDVEGYLAHLPERTCDDARKTMTENALGMALDARDQEFYDARRWQDRFDDVTAAVLLTHGFSDYGPAAFQENVAWQLLSSAPKRQIEGGWGHTFPYPETTTFDPSWANDTWSEIFLSWLEFWLKGQGPVPERLGRVDYQVRTQWRTSSQWPPAEAREEVLYLTQDGLATQPGSGARSFRSMPSPTNAFLTARSFGIPALWTSLCPVADLPTESTGLAFLSEPIQSPATIAGNPFAYLRITSDMPGGILAANFFYLGPDFSCGPGGQPQGTIRLPSYGAADLQFHGGSFTATDFPVGVPTDVRIDIVDLARELDPGSRLGIFLHYGEVPFEYGGRPYFPRITVDAGASHLVVPVTQGSFGGEPPTMAYPRRPFLP